MQDYLLVDPGYEASGRTLRKSAAHTISQYELDTNPDPKLGAFFADCAEKTGGAATDPLKATVANGASVPVKNSAGAAAGANGTITVAASAVTGVKLPATSAVVVNAGNVVVRNSVGTAVPGTCKATVAAGVLTAVDLPGTVATVTSGGLSVPATGTGTAVTITVTNGLITAVTLS